MTFAPPRTGKGATIALNFLSPEGRGWQGSTVVIDPRGRAVSDRGAAPAVAWAPADPPGPVRHGGEAQVAGGR